METLQQQQDRLQCLTGPFLGNKAAFVGSRMQGAGTVSAFGSSLARLTKGTGDGCSVQHVLLFVEAWEVAAES